jgi:pimeloyl-ACP methyl ester carboxylesterase
MTTSQDLNINWRTVPTRTITADGVDFAYRELGADNPGTPVVFLVPWLPSWTTGTLELLTGSRRSVA